MKKTWNWIVVACLCTAPSLAFAETDAGSLPDAATATDTVTTPDDATATADTGPDATGGTWKPANPCWSDKCPTEIAACNADAGCVQYTGCIAQGKATDATCTAGISDASKQLYGAAEQCGYAKCTDPNAGTCEDKCGDFSETAPCNCDEACADYNDCCSDYDQFCGEGPSEATCEDRCGDPYLQSAPCQCDEECVDNEDCCPDYEDLCVNVAPPKDTTSGPDVTAPKDSAATGSDTAAADTAATTGGKTTSSSSSSGCTAGATAPLASGWLFSLVGVAGIWLRRRRA